ncbi:MAG: ABC transporter substrate-binding protein [Actinomycetota bacterium]|nr:ABC transporter substrate-binding protein [Actinomycetota bacterium]
MSPGRPDIPAEGLIDGILQRGEPSEVAPGDTSELLTFLVADIRGYTRFTQQRGDEAAAKLTSKFATVVRELVAQFGGTVFELRGDEALCVFGSPRQSLRAAIALQQRFVDETAADAELPMTVGIGIDAGEAVHGADGYRGGALNLAARLCGQAKAGDVLASSEVTHLARTIEGVRYVVLDRVALKGLTERVRPVRVFPDGEDPARQLAALLAAATPPGTAGRSVRWLPAPLATRPRLTLAAAVAVVAVVVAGAFVFVSQSGGSTGLSALSENSLGMLDPASGHLVRQVGVGGGPVAAAAGFGSVWTANTDADSVSRVDASSGRLILTINVGASPSAIATGPNSVWVANSGSGTVSRIDPATNQPQTIPVGVGPSGIAVAGGSVWVTNSGDATVSRIDPSQNKAVQRIPVDSGPSGISAGRDIWVANSASNTVSKIDGRSHAVTQIRVGTDPTGVAVIGDSVWVTNNLDGTVARISTSGAPGVESVRVGLQPTQIAAVAGRVWIVTQATRTIAEIDPASFTVVRRVPIGAMPVGITPVGGKLWLTTTIDSSRHRGGTIRILGENVNTDPLYVDSVPWLLNDSYDGLVGFRHATGADGLAIVPDLATDIPDPSNGGRTYAFQLRAGIRWSTGRPVTVFDVRRGLERAIVYPFDHPLQQLIVGARGCTPRRCDVPGIAVDAASRTVTITLVRPSGNFLDDLAIDTFAAPAATPLTAQTRPIPATGPYQIARYDPGKLVVLTRNRYFHEWSAAAQPAGFPDRIEWRIDPANTEDEQIRAAKRAVGTVASGATDWADAKRAAPRDTLAARFGARLHVTPTQTMHGVSLNTRVAPFNDVRVRRALAFALDRAAVQADWFTPATITCQFLPPDYPGFRPYCPYTQRPDATGTWHATDLRRAQRLVAASGTRGMRVTVYAEPAQAPGLRHVISALTDLGYRARLVVWHKSDLAYFSYVADSRNKVQAAFYGWVANDASASSFLNTYRCGAFVPASPNNQNPAQFCAPSIDRLMNQAEQVQATSPAAANDLWAQVDRRIVDAAPWIPLVSPTWVDVVSTRVHNYQRSPVLGVFFDQMWVR